MLFAVAALMPIAKKTKNKTKNTKSKRTTEQLHGLREAESISKLRVTWYKVERTNVFNNL